MGYQPLTAAVSGNALNKFADDTYLIIPASNVASRLIELDNIQNWANQKNLKWNCDKTCEVVFTDITMRRRHAAEPAALPGIVRCCSLKICVVIEDDFSFTQHVQRLATSSADKLLASDVALSRSEQRGSAARLPFHRRRSSDVRYQRMTRSHQGIWSSTHQLNDWKRPTPQILPVGLTDVRTMNFVTLRTRKCPTDEPCTHYYRHHPSRHNATIWETVYRCPNIQHYYLTITFSCVCCVRTHISPADVSLSIYFLFFLSCLSFSLFACILSCRNKQILIDWPSVE